MKQQRILKGAREATCYIQGPSKRLTADFSSETMADSRQWEGTFKVLGKKKPQEFYIQQN